MPSVTSIEGGPIAEYGTRESRCREARGYEMRFFTNRLVASGAAGVISLAVLGGGVYALNQNGDGAPTTVAAEQAATASPSPTQAKDKSHGAKHELRAGLADVLK